MEIKILCDKTTDVKNECNQKSRFAEGVCVYKLACLFFISAALGDGIETLFMYITTHRWVCRSSVVYGRFSLVWGIGCVCLTLLLYKIGKKSNMHLFFVGTLIGGIYEYLCSLFTEIAFGTVFWNYSHLPLNFGGRVTIPYCLFWGIVAVIWIRYIYPFLSGVIETFPVRIGKVVCIGMSIFMIVNILISASALCRYTQRYQGIEASNQLERYLDVHFPDDRMEKIYPYARFRVDTIE